VGAEEYEQHCSDRGDENHDQEADRRQRQRATLPLPWFLLDDRGRRAHLVALGCPERRTGSTRRSDRSDESRDILRAGKRSRHFFQRCRECGRSGEASVAIALQRLLHHALQIGSARQIRGQIERLERRFPRVEEKVLMWRGRLEWRAPGEHLVQHDRQRIKVGASVDALAFRHESEVLRRRVS
jgi:hypothetical protein